MVEVVAEKLFDEARVEQLQRHLAMLSEYIRRPNTSDDIAYAHRQGQTLALELSPSDEALAALQHNHSLTLHIKEGSKLLRAIRNTAIDGITVGDDAVKGSSTEPPYHPVTFDFNKPGVYDTLLSQIYVNGREYYLRSAGRSVDRLANELRQLSPTLEIGPDAPVRQV